MKTFAILLLSGFLAACSSDDPPAAPADAGTRRPDAAPIPNPIPDASPVDPDTGPPPTVLTSGEGFSIVYSAVGLIGVEGRPNVQAFFDAKGALTEFYVSNAETLAGAIVSNIGVGGDTIAGWGAWRDGPTTGKWPTKADGRFTFGPGNDFHYAVGRKSLSAAWPATTKTYALAGGTAPTADGVAEPGTLTTATASCDLGPGRTCSFTISAAAGGGTLAISVSPPITTDSTGSGRAQMGGVIALFAGDAAERILLVYGGPLQGGTSAGKNLRGAAVLTAP